MKLRENENILYARCLLITAKDIWTKFGCRRILLIKKTHKGIEVERHPDYAILSSFELIDCIVNKSDYKALHEILKNRKLFYYKNKRLVLSEIVSQLREKLAKIPGFKKLFINDIIFLLSINCCIKS